MLVLTRKAHENVLIGPNVVVSVVDIQRNKVRLSIDAPHHVKILRGELADEGHTSHLGHSPRLLIVDDSEEDRTCYRRYLARGNGADFEVKEAATGEQGLVLCRQEPPDCVLLDYRLPDLDGLEFLDRLHHAGTGHRIPVIMITGSGSEGVAVRAMKYGAVDYLPKREVSPERLQRALHEVFG